MNYLELTLPSPEENLACDEALLELCEEGLAEETLRVWESPQYFVVVGYANQVATEVNVPFCRQNGVPILRRCSGGGTVLQGRGCLNYALSLRIDESGPFRSITSTNQVVLERNRTILQALLQTPVSICGQPTPAPAPNLNLNLNLNLNPNPPPNPLLQTPVQIRGYTDLALGGLKFSGNSQRRKRRALMFHGALLLEFDLALIERALLMPSREPDYRAHRSHSDFLVNFPVPARQVALALRRGWGAGSTLSEIPLERIGKLAREKYATREWTWKFDG
ncbi:MAG TPA: hypothetical protein VN829_14730 [Dongiaceae bacterium]|nr:hypothetical protein [Dongiaceae bacterium]